VDVLEDDRRALVLEEAADRPAEIFITGSVGAQRAVGGRRGCRPVEGVAGRPDHAAGRRWSVGGLLRFSPMRPARSP
jgi:hypothetical protein